MEISWLLGSSPLLSSDKLCKGREEDVKNELGATAQLQVTRLTPARHLVIVHSCKQEKYLLTPAKWQTLNCVPGCFFDVPVRKGLSQIIVPNAYSNLGRKLFTQF